MNGTWQWRLLRRACRLRSAIYENGRGSRGSLTAVEI